MGPAREIKPQGALTKRDLVENWLPRYTGMPIDSFGKFILLTNFNGYVEIFAELNGVGIDGLDRPMPSATAEDISIINFGMGSANAATVMDLLSAISPRAVLFLGKGGGRKRKNKIGDMILFETGEERERSVGFETERVRALIDQVVA